jgi:small subunit ribosomal protein S8
MMTDPIADMLARIRNAGMAKHPELVIPASNATLVVRMRYDDDGQPLVDGLKRVSRPGRRVYVGHEAIPRVRNGLGVAVISTSKGILSDRAAREASIGGEVLCEVW